MPSAARRRAVSSAVLGVKGSQFSLVPPRAVMAVPQSLTFVRYIIGSFLGQLPGNMLGVYFGKNLQGVGSMFKGQKSSPAQMANNIVSPQRVTAW
jgi:hypothetical protein